MGTEYNCGCRVSGGALYPCDYHDEMFAKELDRVETDKKYLKKILKKVV
jgi:hypothetical protein